MADNNNSKDSEHEPIFIEDINQEGLAQIPPVFIPSGSVPSSTFDSSLANLLPHAAGDALTILGSRSFEKYVSIEKDLGQLEERLLSMATELREEKKISAEFEREYEKVRSKLTRKEKLKRVINRVHENSIDALEEDSDLLHSFSSGSSSIMAILAIDIRRSTDLMLHAKKPQLYANFIMELSRSMTSIVLENCGVFDKFTGDGILALFPVFFSGEYAIQHAVRAAALCHEVFEKHYLKARPAFFGVRADACLGIGIDFGEALLTSVHDDLTAVGIPVVYACRLADSASGTTLLNEPAREELKKSGCTACKLKELRADFKNQGPYICFEAMADLANLNPPKASWWSIKK